MVEAPMRGRMNFYSNDGTTLLGSEVISGEEYRNLTVKSNGIFWEGDITVVAVDDLIGITTTVNSKTPEIAVGENIDYMSMGIEAVYYVITMTPEEEFKSDMNALSDSIKAKTDKTENMSVKEMKVAVDGIIKPSGTMEITTNGTHDVTYYASVNVNVGSGGGEIVPEPPAPSFVFTASVENGKVKLNIGASLGMISGTISGLFLCQVILLVDEIEIACCLTIFFDDSQFADVSLLYEQLRGETYPILPTIATKLNFFSQEQDSFIVNSNSTITAAEVLDFTVLYDSNIM